LKTHGIIDKIINIIQLKDNINKDMRDKNELKQLLLKTKLLLFNNNIDSATKSATKSTKSTIDKNSVIKVSNEIFKKNKLHLYLFSPTRINIDFNKIASIL